MAPTGCGVWVRWAGTQESAGRELPPLKSHERHDRHDLRNTVTCAGGLVVTGVDRNVIALVMAGVR